LMYTFIAVIFPAFSAMAGGERERLAIAGNKAIRFALLFGTPVVAGSILLAGPFLGWWLSPEFNQLSGPVLQILSLAVLINFLAYVPAALLQAVERPDLHAKMLLIEVPIYYVALFVLLPAAGIIGAALAWLLRVSLDAVLMYTLAARQIDMRAGGRIRSTWILGASSAVVLAGAWLLSLFAGIWIGCALTAAALGLFALVAWRMLETDELRLIRDVAASFLRMKRPGGKELNGKN
jgi:O-antigen/teichoic acid export membrane protein